LQGFEDDADSRYSDTIKWIEQKSHAVISNGPFYLDSYSPEARTITIRAFDDPTYPYPAGYWEKFEDVSLPQITKISVPDKIAKGTVLDIPITTRHVTDLYYFVNDGTGAEVTSGIIPIQNDFGQILLSSEMTASMDGGNDLKVYAISDSVLRPDIYTTSFSVLDSISNEFEETIIPQEKTKSQLDYGPAFIVLGLILVGIILYVRKSRKRHLIH
jgi:peptide/nickel transport system substrate-binding protein